MAVEADVLLARHARFRRTDGEAVENMDLRLDDIDAGDDLGDRMLDLDARIDLDEVELAGIGIHQILDGACADIVGRPGDLQRIIREFLALRIIEIGRRRPLHDLLVATLDRAVALEKMDDIAVRVAEDLAFDVTGALDELFEIDLVLAEGGLGLALGLGHLADQVLGVADRPHAAAAAAPGGLQHHRIADLLGQSLDLFRVVRQRLGRRHDRHADRDREVAGRDLVAELAHRLRLGADEGDAVCGTGLGEFRAFGEQPIARMYGVGAGELGDADHLVDRQIALDRSEVAGKVRPASDLITLVRLEAVQRQLILLSPYRDRFKPQLIGRAEDADGDFGTVGNKDLGNGQVGLLIDLDTRECCTREKNY